MKSLIVTSSAFNKGELIPSRYSCDGVNVNPPLSIEEIPKESRSLALIIEDPDAPGGMWIHWVVWNINPGHDIQEDSVPGVQGMNDFRKVNYGGPCPPSGVHRYYFKVFALDRMLTLAPGSTKHDLEKAMTKHILARGELMGRYSRK